MVNLKKLCQKSRKLIDSKGDTIDLIACQYAICDWQEYINASHHRHGDDEIEKMVLIMSLLRHKINNRSL